MFALALENTTNMVDSPAPKKATLVPVGLLSKELPSCSHCLKNALAESTDVSCPSAEQAGKTVANAIAIVRTGVFIWLAPQI